jgi:LmbE family N-acetylglucosaminyl deacetylase
MDGINKPDGKADRFLAMIRDRQPSIRERTLVIVAHPDDETIGCAALFRLVENIRIVHVTDGAPRDMRDAARHGFVTAEAYGQTRAAELRAAMALAGIEAHKLVALAFPDQEAAQNLCALVHDIEPFLAGCDIVLTHAFEGGHPDHDATAFAVHCACRLKTCDRLPAIVEMPLYRAEGEGWATQRFAPASGPAETILMLSEEEQDLKCRMLAAHVTQSDLLNAFALDREVFRRAPAHDFGQLPNNGNLLYERHDWGMTGVGWLELARAALVRLELE